MDFTLVAGACSGTSTPTPPPPIAHQWQIVFYTERDGNREIYLMNPDGTGLTRLTNDPSDDGHPAWSPDGIAHDVVGPIGADPAAAIEPHY